MEQGKKYDHGKPMLSLIPPRPLIIVGQVLTFGAQKYDPWNWAHGINFSRLMDADLRHTLAFNSGEDIDPESGLPHLAHSIACKMFLLEYTISRPEFDDRYFFRPLDKKPEIK
jgi:hypothetical protein